MEPSASESLKEKEKSMPVPNWWRGPRELGARCLDVGGLDGAGDCGNADSEPQNPTTSRWQLSSFVISLVPKLLERRCLPAWSSGADKMGSGTAEKVKMCFRSLMSWMTESSSGTEGVCNESGAVVGGLWIESSRQDVGERGCEGFGD